MWRHNPWQDLNWLGEKAGGKMICGRLVRTWEDNIQTDLREVGYEDGRRMELGQDHVNGRALVLAVLNSRTLLAVWWWLRKS
jgi:hypothetical protein